MRLGSVLDLLLGKVAGRISDHMTGHMVRPQTDVHLLGVRVALASVCGSIPAADMMGQSLRLHKYSKMRTASGYSRFITRFQLPEPSAENESLERLSAENPVLHSQGRQA